MKTLYFLIRFYNLNLGNVAKLSHLTLEQTYQVLNNGDTANLEKLLNGINIPLELYLLLDEEINKNPNYSYKNFLELFKVKTADNKNLIGINYKKDRYNKRVDDFKEKSKKAFIYYYKGVPLLEFCNNSTISYGCIINCIRKYKNKNGDITQKEIEKIVENVIDRNLENKGKINYKHQDLEEYCNNNNIDFNFVKQNLESTKQINNSTIEKIIFDNKLIIDNFCEKNNLLSSKVLERYNALERLLEKINYNILYYLTTHYEYSTLVYMHFKYNINTSDELIDKIKNTPEQDLFKMRKSRKINELGKQKIKNNKK